MSRTQSEGDSERESERERLQPEIRVGVSGSQFFSLFLLLERETGHGCNCCRSPSLSHCPLSPVCLPACLLPVPVSSQTGFGYSLRCLSQQTIANHIAAAAASVPYPMTRVSSLPVPTVSHSTNRSSPTIPCQTLCLFASFCRGRSVNCQLGVQFRLAYTLLQGLYDQ